MSKRHQWRYTAFPQQVGLMICTACCQPIEGGDYRYRETEDAYLPQHRFCCAEDPQWAVLDGTRRKQVDDELRRQAAYAAFVAEFGVPYDLVEESTNG